MRYIILKGIKNIRNHIKKSFLVTALLLSTNAHSKIHEFETAHLKSMAGTGAGSLLIEESAFLNPASLSFFTSSSVYAQKDSDKLTENSLLKSKPKAMGFVMSDASAGLSGSLSYVDQKEENTFRKRWGLTLSSPIADKSSMGISVRKTKDENLSNSITQNYYQTVIGVTHSLSDKLSLGIVAYDPFQSKGNETKAIVGVQYTLMSYIIAALDLGGDYTKDDLSQSFQYKAGLQIKVLDDFYIRVGSFRDKLRLENGSGFGLGWLQPRLTLELAMKNTKRDSSTLLNQTGATLTETSMAVSLRF